MQARDMSRACSIPHTGTTPVDYINGLRIALARQLLVNSQLPVEHVAERAGSAQAATCAASGANSATRHPLRWRHRDAPIEGI